MKYNLILNIERKKSIGNNEYDEIIEQLESTLYNNFGINIKLHD